MFRTIVVFALCAIVVHTNAYVLSENNLNVLKSRIHRSIEKIFDNGDVAELRETIGPFDLRNAYEPGHSENYNKLVCGICSVAVDQLINARRNGASRDTMYTVAHGICTLIQPKKVCTGLMDLNVDIILHIVDENKDLDGSKVCSVVFQVGGCDSDYKPTWDIKVPDHQNPPIRKEASGNTFNVLHLTDIHYDPLYQEGALSNCPLPLCCQSDSGSGGEGDSAAGYWTDYNTCDVPNYMVDDTLRQISTTHDLDYVYFTGDIISHRVWDTDIERNTKDIKFIYGEFRKYFGNTTVFPILGNHEPHPVNNWAPDGHANYSAEWVYNLVAEEWSYWLGDECKETLRAGGYYTKLVKPGFRVIGLNSNILYVYNWWLLYDDYDMYTQLKWLNNVLFEAEKNGETVHILSHIPTGDSTSHAYSQSQFIKILMRYQHIITGLFNGHTHYDELIVYFNEDDTPVDVVAYNGGSITPYSDMNPNYRVFKIDTDNYNVVDFDQYMFNVGEANKNRSKSPEWFKEYSFKDAYGLDSLTGVDVAKLARRMAEEPEKILLKQFINFRYRNGPGAHKECDESCMKQILCSMVLPVYGDNYQCDRLMAIWQYHV